MREIEITRGGFTVFARVIGDSKAPALLYLQGGPGFPAPRQRFAWITHALSRGYQVVLLDQRGTGRSTRIDAATPSLIDAKCSRSCAPTRLSPTPKRFARRWG